MNLAGIDRRFLREQLFIPHIFVVRPTWPRKTGARQKRSLRKSLTPMALSGIFHLVLLRSFNFRER